MPADVLSRLQRRIAYRFKDRSLLERAVTHSSYAAENGFPGQDNERLEFLGDSVLGLLAADMLCRSYPSLPVGSLARLKSYLVNEEALAAYAVGIDLGSCILVGKSERREVSKMRPALLADSFEAVMAAVYRDGGLEAAEAFLVPILRGRAEAALSEGSYVDYKTTLQEAVQAESRITPVYRILSEEGPVQNPTFTAAVYAGAEVLGTGSGNSKKAAEQEAARRAFEKRYPAEE